MKGLWGMPSAGLLHQALELLVLLVHVLAMLLVLLGKLLEKLSDHPVLLLEELVRVLAVLSPEPLDQAQNHL